MSSVEAPEKEVVEREPIFGKKERAAVKDPLWDNNVLHQRQTKHCRE